MRALRITLATLTLATGCGRARQEVQGIWHFYASSMSETSCTTSLSHDFDDVWDSEATDTGEGPWALTESSEESQAEFFAALAGSGEEHILLVNGDIYEGTEEDNSWSFLLTQRERASSRRDHQSGYSSVLEATDEAEYRFAGELRRGVFTGTWTANTSSVDAYTESDSWSLELAAEMGTTGAIPSYNYLYAENDFGLVEPLYNTYDQAECDTTPCALTVSTVCQTQFAFVAEQTDMALADWEALEGASQDYGL